MLYNMIYNKLVNDLAQSRILSTFAIVKLK